MKNSIVIVMTLTMVLCVAFTADAVLLDRGGGMIYSTDLNVTWLRDANYARTTGYDADGMMTWVMANAWASNLSYGGFDDWRLPIFDNASGSSPLGEMMYLNEVELGNSTMHPDMSPGPFINLNLPPPEFGDQWIEPWYWSGTQLSADPTRALRYSFWCG